METRPYAIHSNPERSKCTEEETAKWFNSQCGKSIRKASRLVRVKQERQKEVTVCILALQLALMGKEAKTQLATKCGLVRTLLWSVPSCGKGFGLYITAVRHLSSSEKWRAGMSLNFYSRRGVSGSSQSSFLTKRWGKHFEKHIGGELDISIKDRMSGFPFLMNYRTHRLILHSRWCWGFFFRTQNWKELLGATSPRPCSGRQAQPSNFLSTFTPGHSSPSVLIASDTFISVNHISSSVLITCSFLLWCKRCPSSHTAWCWRKPSKGTSFNTMIYLCFSNVFQSVSWPRVYVESNCYGSLWKGKEKTCNQNNTVLAHPRPVIEWKLLNTTLTTEAFSSVTSLEHLQGQFIWPSLKGNIRQQSVVDSSGTL